MPKLSIILPTYNGAKYISQAVESVLRQIFHDWELLIIDDGSTDQTLAVIKNYQAQDNRIKYFRNEKNLGIQKSLNRGLGQAVGDFIARIDDDDEWLSEDKLSKQVEFLDNNPSHILVGYGTVMVDESGRELLRYLLPTTDEQIRGRLLSKNCFTHSAVMFRKKPALNFGGYSEDKKVLHIEDYDLWLKLGTVGKFANLPFYGVKFTLRGKAISSSNKIEQFKKNLKLAKIYKVFYPHYGSALVRGYLRLVLYGFFNFIPLAVLKNKIFKKYKEN
jgi:glycosyltransferase involved in cell wall biosynthesis